MKNLLALIRLLVAFSNLKGAKFVNIKRYNAESGEIADHLVNMNISVMNAKEKDNATLHSVTDSKLSEISKGREIGLEVFNMALSELKASSDQNIKPNLEDRTERSQATTNSYIHITPAIKILRSDTTDKQGNPNGKGFRGDIHLFGMTINKTNVDDSNVEPRKPVNSADKTIAKNIIKKNLDLRERKFRTYKFRRMENVVINKQVVDGQEAHVLTIG